MRSKRNAQKDRAQGRLVLFDALGAVCFEGPLHALMIPEELILALSVKFFNDPEPCYIHRGAVTLRLLAELEAAFPAETPVALNTLSPQLQRYLERYPAVRGVRLP